MFQSTSQGHAMYEGYWKLSKKPFSPRIASERMYCSQSQQAAMLRLRYCLDNSCGAGLLIGQPGVGKSSVLQRLAGESGRRHQVVHVIFPLLNAEENLGLIAAELNPDPGNAPVHELSSEAALRSIQAAARHHSAAGRHPLICFDDAQLLSDVAVQFVVQPLLNLSERDAALRLSVLLAGQPILSSHLRRHTQISDRIAVTAVLQGFTESETADYIQTTLKECGVTTSVFSEAAIRRLFEISGGNPRRINRLCDMALLVGFAEQLPLITEAEIESISHELMPLAA